MTTNKRAKELERQRLQRQAARRQTRASRQRLQAVVAGGVVALLVLGAVIGLFFVQHGHKSSTPVAAVGTPSPTPSLPSGSASAAPSTSPAASVKGTPVCDFASDGTGGPGLPPDRKATGTHTATIALTQGTLKIALSPKAPCTVTSFTALAAKHFFDGTKCHRLTTSGIYVLQCGDPKGDGTGGPGYTIPDENLTGATYPAGTVAMANTGKPHTGGSQFFLVYKATQLPPQYTPFGTITSGLRVLQKIAAAGATGGSGDGAPKIPVLIKSFRVS